MAGKFSKFWTIFDLLIEAKTQIRGITVCIFKLDQMKCNILVKSIFRRYLHVAQNHPNIELGAFTAKMPSLIISTAFLFVPSLRTF